MKKVLLIPGQVVYWLIAVPVSLAILVPRLVLMKMGMDRRALSMRDPEYMEQVIGMPIDREVWELALERTKDKKLDAPGLYGEYAILLHQLKPEETVNK